MPEHRYGDDAAVNVETRHEESDINVRALLWFVVIFIVFAAVTHAGLWLLFKFYVQIGRGATANAPMTGVARPVDANVPPAPRLQPFRTLDANGKEISPTANTPVTDLADMRAAEERALTSYGWVDRQHGIVRIPIEEAKKIALGSNVYTLNNGLQQSPGGAEVILGAQRGTQQKVPVTPGQAVTPAPLPGATTTGGAQ